MDGDLESLCVGRVYAVGAQNSPHTHDLCRGNKITLLHQVGISHYFMRKNHVQTTLKIKIFVI